MVIYKDENRGTWYFVTRVKQLDGTTKQVKRRGFKTKKEAKFAEAKILTEVAGDISVTFEEMTEKYLEWYEKRRKNSSIHIVTSLTKNHLLPEFGKMKLDQIQPKHIMKYQNKILGKYAPDTLKKIHAVLSAIFNFAIKYFNHSTNPAKISGNFEINTTKRMNFWEFGEFKSFIDQIDEVIFKVFFTTLYFSGARKGELLGLLWEDIDFNNNELSINKIEYKREITTPKTKSSIRTIMLPSFVISLLKELKEDQEKKFPVKDSYVVFGEVNKTISSNTLERRLYKFSELAGVKRIVMHEFRHSHASYLINKGVSPMIIAKRLGHADVSETLNRYSHLYPSEELKVIEMIEEDFN